MKNVNKPEDEINFENLLKNPLRLFGMIYPYFALLIIIGGIYWASNLDRAYKNTLNPQLLKRDTVAEPLGMKKGSMMEGVDIKTVSLSTPEMVNKGKELFKANCSSCHGEEGDGQGIAGKGLNPSPRNFHSKDGWKNGRKLSEMWKTLEEGVPGSGMVSYNYLPVTDRFALIHYIHTFMEEFPKDTDEELAQLDITYTLSTGKITANQIPVGNASKALINDYDSLSKKAGVIEKNLIYFRNEPGAKLILENSRDYRKLIVSLLRNNEWKNGQSEFVREIASNMNTNGVKSSVLRLNNNDIQLMYEFFVRTFSQI